MKILVTGGPGEWVIEKDMSKPEIREFARSSPERLRGFDEAIQPNFSFRDGPLQLLQRHQGAWRRGRRWSRTNYIWRLRIPFDENDNSRNYLSKVQRYAKVYDNLNSLSHRSDYVNACLDAWFTKAPFGIYNVTNPDSSPTPKFWK